MNIDDTKIDLSPGGDDGPPKREPLTVKAVMAEAAECLEEMDERNEMLDERLHNVFEVVNLLVTAINVMMTRQQLNVPIPALGMRTTAELFDA